MVGRLIDWLYDDSKFQVTVLTQFFRAVGTPLYFIGYSFIAFGTYLQLHHMFEYPETWHEAYAIFALNATAILSICCGSLLIASDRHMAIKTDSKVISFYNLIEVTMKKGTKLICFWLALLAIVFLFFLVMAYFFPSTVLAKKVQSQEYIDSYNAMKTWITCVAHFYGISFFVMVECRFAMMRSNSLTLARNGVRNYPFIVTALLFGTITYFMQYAGVHVNVSMSVLIPMLGCYAIATTMGLRVDSEGRTVRL